MTEKSGKFFSEVVEIPGDIWRAPAGVGASRSHIDETQIRCRLSSRREIAIWLRARATRWPWSRRGSRLCGSCLGRLEFRLAIERANLHVILGVVFLPRQLLRRPMLRIGPPDAHALLVLELHDGHALAVIGKE